MKLIFARHGETDWNIELKLQGHADRILNENGVRQAHALAEQLSGRTIHAVISSDLKRAAETARVVVAHHSLEVIEDARLRECSYGDFEGMTWKEIERSYKLLKEDIYTRSSEPYDFRPYGGESKEVVLARHKNCIGELLLIYPHDSTLLLVGHGAGFGTFLSSWGILERLGNAEYTEIDI